MVIIAAMVVGRIRVGDEVTLRSGGPVMTVQAVSMSLAYCAWPAGGRIHHGTFEVESLEAAERSARPGQPGADSRPPDQVAE